MRDSTENRLREAWSSIPGAERAVRERSLGRVVREVEGRSMTAVRRWKVPLVLAAACIAVGFAVGALTTTGSSNAATSSAVGFTPSAGWNVISTGAVPLSQGQAAVATNGHFQKADSPAGSFPSSTIKHLGRNGIVLWVFAVPRGMSARVDEGFVAGQLPLELKDARVLSHWETQPNPHVPEYRLWVAIGNVNVDARVYFGTQTPSVALREKAQQELSRLAIPKS